MADAAPSGEALLQSLAPFERASLETFAAVTNRDPASADSVETLRACGWDVQVRSQSSLRSLWGSAGATRGWEACLGARGLKWGGQRRTRTAQRRSIQIQTAQGRMEALVRTIANTADRPAGGHHPRVRRRALPGGRSCDSPAPWTAHVPARRGRRTG